MRGAHLSEGGISILANSSTATGGKLSRIVPRLTSMTTDTRLDIDYIVTEYGHCKLAGLSTSERTKALISIAHPDFREELMRKAKEINCI
ncbi:acetyl-CoA hydrolase/transferase C-terminal domain-containing protein [Francisella orientalis]|uniref:acetyl-CoA hydrolase/transferase C-terminal domain-containing protein n=1 Tax=Francisella orientalis TaxID=299583 RepID=UPI0018C86C70|nr:acetyl-CoA hydrolase/transferase C-terminal domain-containing protein [Francisella orientalis]